MKPLIVDNFIDQDSFQTLKWMMHGRFQELSKNFCWNYCETIDYGDDEDKFQFIHNFYTYNKGSCSPHYNLLDPILQKLRCKEIYRIKANLLTRTPEIVPNTFHTDIQGNWGVIPYTTSILYMNTNNGYTEFENGTKVESVENRWVLFPEDTKHRGTSCTDEKVRVVINFNYLT